jgi:hypothetical protein
VCVYVEVPPLDTDPVTSRSVLPALQPPWPGEVVEVASTVVWPLDFHVSVPPAVNDDPVPVADLLVGDFGVHFLMVMLLEIFPDTFLHTTPVIVTEVVAFLVSEVVATDTLPGPVLRVFVTPFKMSENLSPAFTVSENSVRQVTVVPLVTEQLSTSRLVVVSISRPPLNEPNVVPVGSVTVTFPTKAAKAPVEELLKPIVQFDSTPAPVEPGVTDRPVTDLAGVIETGVVAGVTSEVVETETVLDPLVLGLVTPRR